MSGCPRMRVDAVRVVWFALSLALLAALAGCGADQRPVRIGLLTDCRGPVAGLEESMLAGAALPLLARGGRIRGSGATVTVTGARVAGRPVELVRGCTSVTDHPLLVEEARRLVEVEKVDAVIGPLGEGDSFVVREIAHRYPEVVFVPAWSGPQELTLRGPAANVYRFDFDEAQEVGGLGTYAFRDLGWRTAAIVADPYAIGWHEEAAFVAEFCALGGRIVQRSSFPTEYQAAVERNPAKLEEFDGIAVLVSPYLTAPGELLAALAAKLDARKRIVVGAYVIGDPAVIASAGPRLDGVVGAAPVPPANSTAAMREHRRAFVDAFPSQPPEFAEGLHVLAFHDAMEGLLRGLEATDADLSRGRQRLRAALARVEFQAPASPVRLDRNRQAVRTTYVLRVAWPAGGKPSVELLRSVPAVEQTFGGLLSKAPPPGPGSQPCTKAAPPPWAR